MLTLMEPPLVRIMWRWNEIGKNYVLCWNEISKNYCGDGMKYDRLVL